eukprot:315440-Chlamydomonas_euryale.AAC.1
MLRLQSKCQKQAVTNRNKSKLLQTGTKSKLLQTGTKSKLLQTGTNRKLLQTGTHKAQRRCVLPATCPQAAGHAKP